MAASTSIPRTSGAAAKFGLTVTVGCGSFVAAGGAGFERLLPNPWMPATATEASPITTTVASTARARCRALDRRSSAVTSMPRDGSGVLLSSRVPSGELGTMMLLEQR
jgi:hypothetical protein